MNNYISGWEALNIPYETGEVADWHPVNFLYSNTENKQIKLYSRNELLGDFGIKKRIIKYPVIKEVYIADFPRAILDLLLTLKKDELSCLNNSVNDFLNNSDREKLYKFLLTIKDIPQVYNFLKYEFTNKFYKDLKDGRL